MEKNNRAPYNHSNSFYYLKGNLNMSDYNFTEVEIEVLKLIVKGLEDIEIACVLEIEEDSAREIAENILAKLEARNKIQAAIKAVKAELV